MFSLFDAVAVVAVAAIDVVVGASHIDDDMHREWLAMAQ